MFQVTYLIKKADFSWFLVSQLIERYDGSLKNGSRWELEILAEYCSDRVNMAAKKI